MNLIERAISLISPQWALSRFMARASLQQIEGVVGGKTGYDAGKLNRYTKGRLGAETKEHAIPGEQIHRLRAQSWDLWRNNSYARKIVRSLQSKVIGRGLVPESQATMEDGSPHVQFRARAKQLWKSLESGFDARGLPGRGGLTMAGIQRIALQATILSGETLSRLVPLSKSTQQQRDLPIPLAIQLIDSARLADSHNPVTGEVDNGNIVYRGIELDQDGNRVAYWIHKYPPGMPNATAEVAVRIPAEQIAHLFVEDDIDQIRGVPWFAPGLLSFRDTGDLQYNVLKASAMAACVVLAYRKPTGAPRFGLAESMETNPTSADGTDLTDADGNSITKIQPGMFVNLGKDGDLQGFSPNQPNTNAESFVQHMLRGIASGVPGIKASTVTGDYRNSSFSSERSAENDVWPEIEALQEWFTCSFCQPIYEAVIRAGVLSGYFEGIVTAEEFSQDPCRFIRAKWQGPVSKSINPTDDVKAAGMRMQYGLSSLQQECAALNVNWLDNLNDIAELYETADEKEIPPEVVNNILSVDTQDAIAQAAAGDSTETPMAETPDAPDTPDGPADMNDTETQAENDSEVAT